MALTVKQGEDLKLSNGIKLGKSTLIPNNPTATSELPTAGTIHYNATNQRFEGVIGKTTTFNNSNVVPLSFDIASTSNLGCIKIGNNLTISNDGILNATATSVSRKNQKVLMISKQTNSGDYTSIKNVIKNFFDYDSSSGEFNGGINTLQSHEDYGESQFPDPSASNIYIIYVSPGIYEETTINGVADNNPITLPPYVALVGDNPDTCIIKCNTGIALETNTNSIVSNLTFNLTSADTNASNTNVIGINSNAKSNNKFENLRFISSSFTKNIYTIKCLGSSDFTIDKVNTDFDTSVSGSGNINNFYITEDSSNNGSSGIIKNCTTSIKTLNHNKNALRIDGKSIVTAKYNEFTIEEYNSVTLNAVASESINLKNSNLELLHSKIECIGFDDNYTTTTKNLLGIKLNSTEALASITEANGEFFHNEDNSIYDEIQFPSSQISASEAAFFTYESYIKVSGASNAENNKVFRVMNAYEDTGNSKFIIQLSPNDNLVDESASGDITIKELYSLKLFSTQVFSSSHSIYSSDNNGNYRIQVSKSELTGNDPSVSNDLLVFNYPHFITVGSKDCDFVTISSAMNSIQDASSNKQYIIKVKPGDYYESSTLTIKEYVSLIGESESSCALYFDQNSGGYPDNIAVMLNSNTELKNMKINLSAVNLDSTATNYATNRVIGISTVNLVKTINLGNATSESGASLLTNIVLSDIEVKIEKNVLRSSVFGIYIFKSNYEGKNIKVTGTTNTDQDASFISIYDNATMQTINGFGQSLGTGTITDLTVNISGNKSDCHMNGIFSDRAVIEMNNPSVELINNGSNSATTTPPKNLNKAYNVTNLNDSDFPDGHTSLSEFTNIIFGGIIKSKTTDTAENENYSLFVDFNATLIALSLVTEGENKSQKTSTNNLVNSFLKTLNCYAITRGSSDEITSINDVDKVGLPTITSDSLHVGDPAGAINAVGTKNVIVGIRTGTKNTTGTRNTILGVDSGNTLISGNDNSFYGHDSGNLATGSGNVLMGSNTATTLGTGDLNTVIGKNSAKSVTTMNKSTIIGAESVANSSSAEVNDAIIIGYDNSKLLNLSSTSLNDIIIGNRSSNALVSGLRNIIIGNDAAQVLGTATVSDDDNIMIGHESGSNVNTSYNVMIGTASGQYVSTGTDNTFIGYNTGKGLIGNTNNNASKNVIIGTDSSHIIDSGSQNIVVGASAAQSLTSGSRNIILGSESTSAEGSSGPARSLTTGNENIIMGAESALLLTAGNNNIVMGNNSGAKMNTTSNTIIIGVDSGNELSSSSVSNAVIIGHGAAQKITQGSSIVIGNKSALNAEGIDICIIGNESGKTVTGARNTFIGNYTGGSSEDVGGSPVNGEDNILIGTFAGFSIQSGSKNVIIGSGNTANSAGRNLTTGDSNLIMGYLAGRSLTVGDNNVMFGRSAGYSLADASKSSKNVFVGNYAGTSLTEGENNLIIGNDAGRNISSADSLLLIGQNAGYNGTTSTNNVFIGNDSGYENSVGTNNAYIGNKSGYKNTESENTIIGVSAGEYSTSAADNTFIGYQAGRGKGSTTDQNNTGDKNTFIGFESGLNTVSGFENLYLGYKSGQGNELGSKNIMIGSQTGLNSNASNNVFIGTVTDTSGTVGVGAKTVSDDLLQGINNVMIGTNTGINNTFGAENIFIGSDSGKSNTLGSNNIYFGDNAGGDGSNSHKNICIGKQAGEDNVTGNTNIIIGNEAGKTIGANTDDNIIIGNQAGQSNNIDSSIFIGAGAGKINTTGSGNIFLGKNAGLANQTSSNNIMIGSNSGASCAISGSDGENIYIGHLSGDKNVSGTRNIVIGSEAFDSSTQGGGMIAVGYQAGKKTGVLAENVGGNTYNNTIIGFEAGSQGDININNVLVGAKAGRNVDNPRKFANNLFLGTESGQNSNLATQSIVVGNAGKTGTGGNKNIIMGDSTGDNLGNPRLPVSNVTTISTISSGDINAIIDMPYSSARYYFDDGDNILIQDSDQSNFHETTIAGIENNITNTLSALHNVTTSGTTSIASGVTVTLASATTVKLVIGTVITFKNNGVLTLTAEAALGTTSLIGNLTVANLINGDKSISIISESKSKLLFSTKYSNSLSQTIANGANIISLAKLSTKIGDLDDSKYSSNTLMGHNTGSNITLGSKNVALGPEAFINNKKGKYNNVLGTQAAYNVKSDNNTCMGTRAGFSLDSYSNTNNTIATDLTFTSNTNIISSTSTTLSGFNFGTTFEVSGSSNNDGDYIIESSQDNSLIVKGIPQIEEIGVPNNVDPDAITISGNNFNFVNSTITATNFQVVSLISAGVKYTGLGPQTGQDIDSDIVTIKKSKMLEISGSKFNDGFYYIDDETTIPTNISSNIKILILNANLQPETFTSSVSIKLNNIKVNTISSTNNFDDILNDNKLFVFFGTNKAQMTVSNDMNYFPITKPYNSNSTSNVKVTNTIIPQETLLNVTNDDNIIFTIGLKDSIYTSDSIDSDTYLNFFKKETNAVNIVFTAKTDDVVGTITNADTSTNLLFTGSSGFIEFSNTSSNNKLIKISGGSPNSSYNVDSNYSVTGETDTDAKLALATLNEVGKDLSSELSKGDLITVQYEHTNGLNLERGSFLVDSAIVDATKNIIFLNTEQFINPFKNGIFKDQFNPSSSYPSSSSNKIMSNVNFRINKDFQKIDTAYINNNNYLHGYDFMFQTGQIDDPNDFTLDSTENIIISTTNYIFSELVPPVMIKANDNYYLVEKNDFPHNKLEIDSALTPVTTSAPSTFPGMVHTFTPAASTITEYRGKNLLFKPDSADNTKYDFGHTTGSEKVLGTGTTWTDTPPDNSGVTSGSGWTTLILGDDELSSAISLSANNFTYFGETISEIIISSNGNIQLDSTNTSSGYSNSSSDHWLRKQISFLWDDLNPTSSGTIKYGYMDDGSNANAIFVLAFIQVHEFGTSNENSIQIKLFLNNADTANRGKIEIKYGALNLGTSDSVTIGISNAIQAETISFNNYVSSTTTTNFTGVAYSYTNADSFKGKTLMFSRNSGTPANYDFAYSLGTNWSSIPPDNTGVTAGSGWTTVSLSDDSLSSAISLSTNNFKYFGTDMTEVYISSNGNLQFDSSTLSTTYSHSVSNSWARKQISFLWDDLNPSSDGTIKYGFMTTNNTNDTFVIAIIQVHRYGTSDDNSVQIKLFLNNADTANIGKIELAYGVVKTNSLTIGVSNAVVGSEVDFTAGATSTTSSIFYHSISSYNNSSNLKALMNTSNTYRVIGSNNNNLKEIKVQNETNTLQEISAYLTSDSSINTYNSNDMVISLETNDNQAKGYRKGFFKNLSFTATNVDFNLATGVHYIEFSPFNTTEFIGPGGAAFRIKKNDIIKVTGASDNRINNQYFQVSSNFFLSGGSETSLKYNITVKQITTLTSTTTISESSVTFTINQFESNFFNFNHVQSMIGSHSNFLRFGKIRLETEKSTINTSITTENAYIDKSYNFTVANNFHANGQIDNEKVIYLEETVPNEYNPVEIIVNDNQTISTNVLTSSHADTISINISPSLNNYVASSSLFRLQMRVNITSGATISSGTSLTISSLSNPLRSGTNLIFTSASGIFTLSQDALIGTTTLTGNITSATISSGETSTNYITGNDIVTITAAQTVSTGTGVTLTVNTLTHTIPSGTVLNFRKSSGSFLLTGNASAAATTLTGTLTGTITSGDISNNIYQNTDYYFGTTENTNKDSTTITGKVYKSGSTTSFTINDGSILVQQINSITTNSSVPDGDLDISPVNKNRILSGKKYIFSNNTSFTLDTVANSNSSTFSGKETGSLDISITPTGTITSGTSLSVNAITRVLPIGTIIKYKTSAVGVFTLTSAAAVGDTTLTGTFSGTQITSGDPSISVLLPNESLYSSQDGILEDDLDRFDNYAISIGTPVVSAGGDATKEKQNIETPPRGFINTFIDSADNGAAPSIKILDTSVDQLQGTITLVKDTSADGTHTMELSSIAIVSGKIYTVKNTPLGYLDLINTPFKLIRPNTYLRIQYDNTSGGSGAPSDYDYTVMVDKLINNKKIQFKFVEGVFSSNPDNITVATTSSGTKTSADTSLPVASLTHKLATGSVINFTTTTTGSITLTANAAYGATTLTGTITGTITLGTSSASVIRSVTFNTTDTLKISIRFQNNISKVVATTNTTTSSALGLVSPGIQYAMASGDKIIFESGTKEHTAGGSGLSVGDPSSPSGTTLGTISIGDVSKSVTIASGVPNEALSGQIISNRYNFTEFKKASASDNKTITDAFSLVNYLLIHKLPILNSKLTSPTGFSSQNYYYNNYKIPDSSFIDNDDISNLFDIYIITPSGAISTDTSITVTAIKHNLPNGTVITFPSSITFRLTTTAVSGATTLSGICSGTISANAVSVSVNINTTPEITTDSGMSIKDSDDTSITVAALTHSLKKGSIITFSEFDTTYGRITLTSDAAIGTTTLSGNIEGIISNNTKSSDIISNSNSINSLPFSYAMNTGNLANSRNEQIEIYDKGNHSWIVPTSNVSATLSTTNLSFKNIKQTGAYVIDESENTITKTASSDPFDSFAVNDLFQLENSASNNDGFYKISSISGDNKTITIDSTYNTFKADETTGSTFNIISQIINSSDSINTDLSLYNPGQKVIVTETENNNNVMLISEDTPTTANSIFIVNSGQITTETSPKFCKIEKCVFEDEVSSISGHNDISFDKNDSDSTLSTITTSNSSANFLSFVPNQLITISGTTLNNGNFTIGNTVPTLTHSPTTYTLKVPISADESNQTATIKKRITLTKLGEAVITTTSTGVVKFHYLDAQGNNTMIGSFTGQYAGLNAYSIHNLFIGNKVGQTNQGSGNIFIGNETGFAKSASDGATTFNNKFAVYKNNFIGVTTNPLIGGDFASGTVGINTINPDSLISTGTLSSSTKLVVNGKVRAQSHITFTGCHIVNITSSLYQLSPGMILVSTGAVSYIDNIDTLVSCQISTTDNQKTVYGAYIDCENTIDSDGNSKIIHYCASVGEGTILVTNINGNILNGDYITTSLMPGYGKRQDDDILRSYTVAKCTETIMWDNISNNITYNGSEYKSCRVACTYHCG